MKLTFAISAIFSVIVLNGCSSSDKKPQDNPAYSREYIDQQKEVSRDATTTWDKQGQRGAAIEQGAYKDVLGKRKIEKFDYPLPKRESGTPANDANALLTNPTEHALNNAGVSYTVYEKSRWSRYCGAGKMDKRDIAFILKEGLQNLPEEYAPTCKKPSWELPEFESAWSKKCSGAALNSNENAIVRETIQPSKCTKG